MNKTFIFERKSTIPCSADELFRWHETPDAFQKLMPPNEPVKVLYHDGNIRDGARAILLVGYWPFRFRWELQHQDYAAGRKFCDVQVKGPFTVYRHEHMMACVDGNHSVSLDRITFVMPFGWLGSWIGRLIILPKFTRLFAFRHDVTRKAFA